MGKGDKSRRAAGWIASILLVSPLVVPSQAPAFPLVGLYLEGEPEELGRGGDPFRNFGLEARRLERPALLAGTEAGWAILSVGVENTLSLRSGTWAGTQVFDRNVGVRAYLPLGEPFDGFSLGVFAGFDQLSSRIRLRNDGTTLLELQEDRTFPTVGIVTSLPYGVALAAGVDGLDTGALRWLFEGRIQPMQGLTFWVRRRDQGFRQTARVPAGVATNVYSPELHLPLDFQRAETELGGEVALPWVWTKGGITAERAGQFWVEAGGMPAEWLSLRLGADGSPFRLADDLVAQGSGGIAALDLSFQRNRAFAATNLLIGPRDEIEFRYIFSRIHTRSSADERGTEAAKAFLHVDTDLGLLFQGEGALQGHQLGGSWSRTTLSGLRLVAGAQYIRVGLLPSELSLESYVMRKPLAEETLQSVAAHLLGVSGFLEVPLGAFRFGVALGQLIPLSIEEEGSGDPGGPSVPPAPKPKAGPFDWIGDLVDTLQTTSGGTRLMFQASIEI